MLFRGDLTSAVFIGGMEGILAEYEMFAEAHPDATVLTVPGPGGAARQLSELLGITNDFDLQNVDFAKLFHAKLGVQPNERRDQVNPGGHNGTTGIL
jgi:hypothetical protein